jgi:hypothetical protein
VLDYILYIHIYIPILLFINTTGMSPENYAIFAATSHLSLLIARNLKCPRVWAVCSDMLFLQSFIKVFQTEDAVVWSMVLRQGITVPEV